MDTDSLDDIALMSMQLRKVKASAIATSSVDVARELVKEQATAQGNFPGPCIVLYTGDDIEGAKQAGVDAVIAETGAISNLEMASDVGWICKVSSIDDVKNARTSCFAIDADSMDEVTLFETLQLVPSNSLVVLMLSSMQEDNAELDLVKSAKDLGVSAAFFKQAVVGDDEDIEYATFLVDSLTKKKSSKFNMTGLTGSTNGHFGGVASAKVSKSWLRQSRR